MLQVITATKRAYITGVNAEEATDLLQKTLKPALVYRHNPKAVASVVLLWPGFVGTVASTIILFLSHKHDAIWGPKSTHARERDEKNATVDGNTV